MMNHNKLFTLLVFAVVAVAPANELPGHDQAALARQYYLDIQLFSIIPDKGIDSYRSYGAGNAGGPATLVLNATDERQFALKLKTSMRSGDFIAALRVEPHESDKVTKAFQREFVLSDLQLQTIEIVRNEDGRVYVLNIHAGIKVFPNPRPFEVEKLQLENWSFPDCPVIVDDQEYVGRISMSSAELAFIDLSGLAKIEFSLLPFRDAMPLGSLEDGVINIIHSSGTTVQISNVANGAHREVLPGGPYQVFVRWSEPSMSVPEYRIQLKKMIAAARKRLENGDLPAEKNWLQRLERAENLDRIMMMTSGLGPIPREDRME